MTTRPSEASPPQDFAASYIAAGKAAAAEPFVGITSDGTPIPGLFPLRATGVSTLPIQLAADVFLRALTERQRAQAVFLLDTPEWRTWSNIHPALLRHGVPLMDMTAEQRDLALALLRANLSDAGFQSARDVMRLNDVIAELTGKPDEYGSGMYWFSIMGTPSEREPWGWQLDGQHLIINCVIVGDQLVMTPMFMGSEPVLAETGPHAGIRVFAEEERHGLALMQALTPEQQARATLAPEPPREVNAGAFRDNLTLPYAGICYDEMTPEQQIALRTIVMTYNHRIRSDYRREQLEKMARHMGETWFAWRGGVGADAVYYYRVHSPVILIEFDHQRPQALAGTAFTRNHIHTLVRTSNGNDYGRDLLRQHLAKYQH